MQSLLIAGIGTVRTVAKKYCLWCNSYTNEFQEVRHVHDIIFRGCESCVERVVTEVVKGNRDGKHAA